MYPCVTYPLDESRPTGVLWNPPDYSKSKFLSIIQLEDISHNVLIINLCVDGRNLMEIINHEIHSEEFLSSSLLTPSLHEQAVIVFTIVP